MERIRRREEQLLREVWRQNDERAKLAARLIRIRADLESPKSRTPEGQQSNHELRSEIMKLKASAVPPNLTSDLKAKSEKPKNRDSKSSKRSTINAGLSEQLGRSQSQFGSRCSCS